MPRKNEFHSSIVISLLREQKWCKDFEFVPIHKLQHQKVLEVLRDTLLFLSFGHPEGFGLPVAEALVNCCAVVGYSGLGGRELMNVAENANTAFGVEFGDLHGFVDNTFQILSMMNHDFLILRTGHCKCLIELVLSILLSLFVYPSLER